MDASSVHRICAGQVVLDLAAAVKELVENAMDADTKVIEVRLRESGAALIEVADNGTGIPPESHGLVATRHCTSKLATFDDLAAIASYGFRGEALSSLATLGNLVIVTRTETTPDATKLTFDHAGALTSSSVAARGVGTTVSCEGLFERLPVRRKEFARNAKRELAKCVALMHAYALIGEGTRFTLTNGSATLIACSGKGDLRSRYTELFGAPAAMALCAIPDGVTACDGTVAVRGWVSRCDVLSKGHGGANGVSRRASTDRQYFYINNRPVDLPRVARVINEVFRANAGPGSSGFPCVALCVTCNSDACDVNLNPDKRKVLLQFEDALVDTMRETLTSMYAAQKATFERGRGCTTSIFSKPQPELQPTQRHTRQATPSVLAHFSAHADGSRALGPETSEPGDNGKTAADGETTRGNMDDGAEANHATNAGSRAALAPPALAQFSADFQQPAPHRKSTDEEELEPATAAAAIAAEDAHASEPATLDLHLGKPFAECIEPTMPPGIPRTRGKESKSSFERNQKRKRVEPRPDNSAEVRISMSADDEGMDQDMSADDEGENQEESEEGEEEDQEDAEEEDEEDVEEEMEQKEGSDGEDEEDQAKEKASAPIAASNRCSAEPQQETSLSKDDNRANCEVRDDSGGGGSGGGASGHHISKDPARGPEPPMANASPSAVWATPPPGIVRGTVAVPVTTDAPADLEVPRAISALPIDGRGVTETNLHLHFNKEHFKTHMRVVGQFNLGFILAVHRTTHDIFIIDQHASDEIFNFERLFRTVPIHKQRLIQPIALEVTPDERDLLRDHVEVFRWNGFDLDESSLVDGTTPLLTSVPFSRVTTFGKEDALELLSMLEHGRPSLTQQQINQSQTAAGAPPAGTVVRPSKVRTMFASRACRSSIMIGRALKHSEMRRILANLAGLYAPWNCPHGRSTMRHLSNLRDLHHKPPMQKNNFAIAQM